MKKLLIIKIFRNIKRVKVKYQLIKKHSTKIYYFFDEKQLLIERIILEEPGEFNKFKKDKVVEKSFYKYDDDGKIEYIYIHGPRGKDHSIELKIETEKKDIDDYSSIIGFWSISHGGNHTKYQTWKYYKYHWIYNEPTYKPLTRLSIFKEPNPQGWYQISKYSLFHDEYNTQTSNYVFYKYIKNKKGKIIEKHIRHMIDEQYYEIYYTYKGEKLISKSYKEIFHKGRVDYINNSGLYMDDEIEPVQ